VEGDFLSIREMLGERGAGHEARDFEGYVVAEQEGKLLGFGVASRAEKGVSRYAFPRPFRACNCRFIDIGYRMRLLYPLVSLHQA